jgi:hypothetical protein
MPSTALPVCARKLLNEVLDEKRQVVLPVRQRWQLDMHHRQPKE